MKKNGMITLAVIVAVVLALFFWCKNSYNRMVTAEEGVGAAWAQVENVYQRRADLIPNLVATVKGYANLGEKASSPEADPYLDLLYPEASFKGLYEYAVFWTADEASTEEAYYRYLFQQSSELKIGKADKKYFGASVRCVK